MGMQSPFDFDYKGYFRLTKRSEVTACILVDADLVNK